MQMLHVVTNQKTTKIKNLFYHALYHLSSRTAYHHSSTK